MERLVKLSGGEWARLQRLLPPEESTGGCPPKPHRPMVEGMLWVLRTGAPWRDLPNAYGPWQSVLHALFALEPRGPVGADPRCARCRGRHGRLCGRLEPCAGAPGRDRSGLSEKAQRSSPSRASRRSSSPTKYLDAVRELHHVLSYVPVSDGWPPRLKPSACAGNRRSRARN